jgi:signal transduction histidine kinase
MPLAAAVGRRPDRVGEPGEAGDREGRARLLWLGVVSMRGQVRLYQGIAPPGPGFRLTQAPAVGRLLPVGAIRHELGPWLAPLLLIAVAGVGGGILAGGLPAGGAGPATVGLLAAAAALSVAGLTGRIGGRRAAVPALVGVGMCGAGLDLLADGTGYVIGYMAVVGLALRTPPRVAVLAGSPVVAAIAVEEAFDSANPAATSVAVLSAFGFLFTISEFAAASLGARHQAEALLAQETAAGEARERTAALAERSRLARDLHDVLAHSLSVLAVQLEAARLTAITEAAGANLVGQITSAHKLTRIGVLNARRALAMLRDDEPPGPASLPGLVSETAAALGIPIALEVEGVPRPLDPETGLMLYRVVQEALANVAKHAGRGVRVTVRLAWTAGGVEVSVVDSGGDGAGVGLPSGGLGLTGMSERAELRGGRLRAGRSGDGFAVRLWLPALWAPRTRRCGCSSPTIRRWSATGCPCCSACCPGSR